MNIPLLVKATRHGVRPGIKVPHYNGDAGFDLIAVEETVIGPGQMVMVPHGFQLEMPSGSFGYIMPRSSTITLYNGNLLVLSSPVDWGYRGEMFTMVKNLRDREAITVYKGDRISQLVLMPLLPVDDFKEVDELRPTHRAANGFGSTGK